MSGFFFCGIMLEPAAIASPILRKPNSLVVKSMTSVASRESARSTRAPAHVQSSAKSRSPIVSSALAVTAEKRSSSATMLAIDRQRRARARAAAERRLVRALDGDARARRPRGGAASTHAQMRNAAETGCARCRCVYAGRMTSFSRAARSASSVGEARDLAERARRLIAHVEAQAERDLVVARTCSVQPLADVAEVAREARLDRHVHVLFAVGEHELARGRLVVHREERAAELLRVVGLEEPDLPEHRDVRGAAEDVLADERAVVRAATSSRRGARGSSRRARSRPSAQLSASTEGRPPLGVVGGRPISAVTVRGLHLATSSSGSMVTTRL